jgi:cbb3-type cytochrome oxidase subunit 1
LFTLVRRFIKTGVGFLTAGLLLGAYMLVQRELLGQWPNRYLVSAHVHAVFLGFVMFIILGVALWLFPRAEKTDTRYKPGLIEAAYWILTLATLSRFIAEMLRAWLSHPALAIIVLIGGLGQVVGLLLYFWTMWSRIRPLGSRAREAAGERF